METIIKNPQKHIYSIIGLFNALQMNISWKVAGMYSRALMDHSVYKVERAAEHLKVNWESGFLTIKDLRSALNELK